jgi:hypothetical protein
VICLIRCGRLELPTNLICEELLPLNLKFLKELFEDLAEKIL